MGDFAKKRLAVALVDGCRGIQFEGDRADLRWTSRIGGEGPALARQAVDIAQQNGTTVALSLSDSFCVDRHRASFEFFVRNGVDIIVADEEEVNALLGSKTYDEMLEALTAYDNLFAITRSEKGSVIVHGDEIVIQPADKVEKVVDTTGAGDAYSAGFLFGWANDLPLQRCAEYGTFCATRVIQQVGARIEPGLDITSR